jgi:hypothetical protein
MHLQICAIIILFVHHSEQCFVGGKFLGESEKGIADGRAYENHVKSTTTTTTKGAVRENIEYMRTKIAADFFKW